MLNDVNISHLNTHMKPCSKSRIFFCCCWWNKSKSSCFCRARRVNFSTVTADRPFGLFWMNTISHHFYFVEASRLLRHTSLVTFPDDKAARFPSTTWPERENKALSRHTHVAGAAKYSSLVVLPPTCLDHHCGGQSSALMTASALLRSRLLSVQPRSSLDSDSAATKRAAFFWGVSDLCVCTGCCANISSLRTSGVVAQAWAPLSSVQTLEVLKPCCGKSGVEIFSCVLCLFCLPCPWWRSA